MQRDRRLIYIIGGTIVALVIIVTILGPELVSRRYDNLLLKNITLEEKNAEVMGYKYVMSADEKLYVLANALNNRLLPQSDYFAAIRWQDSISNTQTQSYAFQPVFRDSEYNSVTQRNALNSLKTELDLLSENGVIPALDFNSDTDDYEATLFSAIDILEPKNYVSVWQIVGYGGTVRDGLMDCIMDAQTNKLYSFSIRTEKSWEQYDADKVIRLWAEYLGTSVPETYVQGSPLVEDATHYQKYAINGMEGDQTIVTVGYYEGVQEFFIKIMK